MVPFLIDTIAPNPARASLLGRVCRWLRRHLTRDGRELAKRLEGCRP